MAHAEDMIFEEINVIRSKFEGVGELLNIGDGSFYGSVTWTPTYRGGAVFRVAPNQEPELIHAFEVTEEIGIPDAGGAGPSAALVEGPDGAMYGATKYGGVYGAGTIYRITSAGVYSVVRHLNRTEVCNVNCLTWGPDGSLYGTGTFFPIPNEAGTGILFRLDPSGNWESLYQFPNLVADFESPREPNGVAIGSDGEVYGITRWGGKPISVAPFTIVSHGVFYRLEEPGEITVLGNFGEEEDNPLFMRPTDGGFYITTYGDVSYFTNSGTHTLIADFATEGKGNTATTTASVITEDGFFGITDRGGDHGAGFVYQYKPGEGLTYLHELAMEYRSRDRGLALGNDGQIYGFAGFPENEFGAAFSGMSTDASAVDTKAGTGGKTGRAFRFRKASAAANLVPVAKPDSAVLPAKAIDGKRAVTIKVLGNDRDADRGDKLTITSVSTVTGATVEIVTPKKGAQSIRFTTAAAEPVGAEFTYEVSDGKGGTATGTVTVLAPASGKFAGTATAVGEQLTAALSIVVDKKNGVSAVFNESGKKFTGKGQLGTDDTAVITLKSKGQDPYTLQVSLERGTEREIDATLTNGDTSFTATCTPVVKKKK
ncbi:choice-of-anchor tandem repeat GloVer-containing protein [Luteolibacter luteus]|uniref:Cadherin-like domain-containing protein n=1 Tax=Luteolibacter luteus TaxID=2728835 RepID=A0A858RSC4_9BACT|nr:choice-of-anchor tandem repeat GloVer-containing protein [Luteolibacter luteus]QJE99080.1 cadherin-like domain-containing protein [Luteolibacter luteus]